jgi:hypothetical protein
MRRGVCPTSYVEENMLCRSCPCGAWIGKMRSISGRLEIFGKQSSSIWICFLFHAPAINTASSVESTSAFIAGTSFRNVRCVLKPAPLRSRTPSTVIRPKRGLHCIHRVIPVSNFSCFLAGTPIEKSDNSISGKVKAA